MTADGDLPGVILRVVGLAREARLARGPSVIGTAGLAEHLRSARAVVSFGLCGALDTALKPGDLVIGEAVVAGGQTRPCDPSIVAALAQVLPQARRGSLAGGEAMIATAAEKAALRVATGAIAVDMESLAVARAAMAAALPFVVLRAVSDGADHSLPRAALAGFSVTGTPDVAAVIASLARRPWELPALIRTAREAEAGFQALGLASGVLDPAVLSALAAS